MSRPGSSPPSRIDTSDAARELFFVFGAATLYYLVRGLASGRSEEALANARRVAAVEKQLGICVESAVQAHTLRSPLQVGAWNAVYLWGHLPLLATFAAWLYTANREVYGRLRRVFLISQALGAAIYYLFPVAPPRLMPAEYGYVDTLADRHEIHYQLGSVRLFLNEYAAMPSLHFGWSLLMTAGLLSGVGGWKAGVTAVLSPIASMASIVATANHWVLDAVGGAAVMALAFGAERRFFGANAGKSGSSAQDGVSSP
ncbi:MAG: PAP2 family protein [Dehalococcoidia bacterium]|nr:PAP2 family protein [Dehalococcoidia bacterium]